MKGTAARSRWEIISSHIFTYFNFLNLVLAGLILISGQYKNMLFMGIVITNAVIGIVQELKVKRIIDALSVVTATKARRLENGKYCKCDIGCLKEGDTLQLLLGDQIPVDCEVLNTDGMEVNESLLTGESLAVQKKQGDFVYSGSDVVAGSAIVKVLHTGEKNYATQLVKKAKTKRRATSEMQDAIGRIIKYISYALIPIGLLLFFIQRYSAGNTLSDSIVNTVAGVIGMIPEGLVLLTSISFILGVGRLAKKKALVQEMEAIEALARVDVLCLDKTGTITSGELQVEEVVPLADEDNLEDIIGVIAYAFQETNATTDALRRYFPKATGERIVEKVPFSSSRKHMRVTIEGKGEYCLGAPEYLTENTNVLAYAEKYEAEGMRVLLLSHNEREKCFIILSDVVKADAAETFRFFREKNVQIKILSGDNPLTVSVVGMRAGLPEAKDYVDARKLPEDEKELRKEIARYTVFGRVTPEKKQAIVKALEAEGNVTGMVGDGVNDVLALKEADCGIAMASGSDAAKQIAHIVLLDCDFSSMKQIVGEGRTIISNIERVSTLYLTKTIYSILLCVIYIILGMSYPFIPIQLSLIGGTAIGIPSFVLALEHHEETIPRGFLRNVMRVSLPAAICMVGSLVAITIVGGWFSFSELVLSSLHLMAGGIVSFGVLIAVCIPMSRVRFVLCLTVVGIFVGAILLFPGFFGMAPVMHLIKTLL
ncbi:MAG: HAD-IC family P-type ATPase [Eubacterium sp.]